MTAQERLEYIGTGLEQIRHGWAFVAREIDARIKDLTEQLVNQDNEQTRGRIKALAELKELPHALYSEREGISAALADEAAAE